MKKIISTALLFGIILFAPSVRADFGKTDLQGCGKCVGTECIFLGLKDGQRFCRPELASPHIPTPKEPRCPENSGYHAETGKCGCFQGTFARGTRCIPYFADAAECPAKHPENPREECPQIPAPNEACRIQYGENMYFSEKVGACVCRPDYTLTAENRCVRSETPRDFVRSVASSLVPYTDFGKARFLFLAPHWDLKSALSGDSGSQSVRISWNFLFEKGAEKPFRFHVALGDREKDEWILENFFSAIVKTIAFSWQEGHSYVMVLEAQDEEENTLARVEFTF